MIDLISPEAPAQGAWKKAPNGQSLLATHYATIFGGKEYTPSVKHYFVPGSGIAYTVIKNNIYHYLGNDAIVRSGCQENPLTGQIQEGYVIKSSLNLTAAMILDLKADSVLYEAERQPRYSFWILLWLREMPKSDPQDLIILEIFFWVISGFQFLRTPSWYWGDFRFIPESQRSTKPMSKAQMEFLKTLWGVLEEIIELIQIVRVYTALILETVSSGFSKFPNSMRPPCTTMPWTIWPALVVLWGVCWMFQAVQNAAVNPQLSLQELEQFLFPNSDVHLNPPGTLFSVDQPTSTFVPFEDLPSLPTSIGGLDDIEFHRFSAAIESNEAFYDVSEPSAPSLEEEFPSNFLPLMNPFEAGSSIEMYPVTASAAQNLTTSLHGEGSMVGLTVGANPQPVETAQSRKAPATYTRPKNSPLTSNGKMTCNHLDCSNNKNLIFTNFGEWSKHQNKHDRPFKCTVASCTWKVKGFTSKDNQERHQHSVHKILPSGNGTQSGTSPKKSYFCDEPGCKRGPGHNYGFPRKDNLKDHVKRKHKRDLAPSRVSIREGEGGNGVTILANQGLEQQQIGFSLRVPGNQKRTATQAAGTSDEETTARKKSRQEDQESNSDMEPSPREDALAELVEKLKKELKDAQKKNEKAQKENEVLIGIIDRLTQGPR